MFEAFPVAQLLVAGRSAIISRYLQLGLLISVPWALKTMTEEPLFFIPLISIFSAGTQVD